jgi:hypothetical protein
MKKSLGFVLAAVALAVGSTSAQAVTILRYKSNVGAGFGLGADVTQTMGFTESQLTSFAQQNVAGVNGTLGSNISIAKYLLETNATDPTDSNTANTPFTYQVDVWVNGNAADNYIFTIKGKRTIKDVSGDPSSMSDVLTIDAGFSNLVGVSAITGTNIFLNFQSFDQLDAPGPSAPLSNFDYDTADGGSSLTYRIHATEVPEPGTLAMLFGAGATGLLVVRRRK